MIRGAVAVDIVSRSLSEAMRMVKEPIGLYRDAADWKEGLAARPGAVVVPGCDPSQLGGQRFCDAHGLKYPYVAGAMAGGISSVELVAAMARAGMLGVFGAAGLPIDAVERSIHQIRQRVGTRPFAVNMIFTPQQPEHERLLCELLLRKEVRLVAASAYVQLTPHIVRYRFKGTQELADGTIVTPNRLIAKVSREELAEKFLSPPPASLLTELVNDGHLSPDEARLAARLPVAEDVTVEADSGGHTDNRPAMAALPQMIALRDRLHRQHAYQDAPRIGAAGGLATPQSVAGAFAMGANYVVTGSINQACVESGTSDHVRAMLAEARQADCAMAPAADMFEMGARVQVLKRGTMYPFRAGKLDQLYRNYQSLEQIPAEERSHLEEKVFRASFEQVWEETSAFFQLRDPEQLQRAAGDPRHRMALVFRWYLGRASGWAVRGDKSRQLDYQIWCGPAMGAFNSWTQDSPLAHPENRRVVDVAHNLLHGAALVTRLHVARIQGADLAQQVPVTPLPRTDLARFLD